MSKISDKIDKILKEENRLIESRLIESFIETLDEIYGYNDGEGIKMNREDGEIVINNLNEFNKSALLLIETIIKLVEEESK